MADEIHAEHGSLDVLMNVAGIAVWGTVDTLSHEQWRRRRRRQPDGPDPRDRVLHAADDRGQRGGHLVNVSSAAGLFGLPLARRPTARRSSACAASPRSLRFDLRRHDIGVSLVCPGARRHRTVETSRSPGSTATAGAGEDDRAASSSHAASPRAGGSSGSWRGVERNRYWVYTSRDIQIAPLPPAPLRDSATRGSCAAINDRFTAIARRASRPSRARTAAALARARWPCAGARAAAGAADRRGHPLHRLRRRLAAGDGHRRGAARARPTIVEFSPYGRGTGTFDGGPAYNHLLVQIRGTGDSDGGFDALGPRTQKDVAEVLALGVRPAVERRPPRPERLLGQRDHDLQLAAPSSFHASRPRC